MAEEILNVVKREPGKKGASRRLRSKGFVPGIYYYHGKDNIPLAIEERELDAFFQKKHPVIRIKFDNDTEMRCIIREIQKDTISGKYLHVDFRGVKKGEKVDLNITIRLVGTPAGVKDGGVLEHSIREIPISCLPKDILDVLEIDISELNIGDSVHVRDLDYQQFSFLVDENLAIATVVPPSKVIETVAAEAEGEEGEDGEGGEETGGEDKGEEEQE